MSDILVLYVRLRAHCADQLCVSTLPFPIELNFAVIVTTCAFRVLEASFL